MILQIHFNDGAVKVGEYKSVLIEEGAVEVTAPPYTYSLVEEAKSIYLLQCGKPMLLWDKHEDSDND